MAVAPRIFTLGSKSVYERLCTLKKTPDLASFIPNPQVAKLILYSKKVDSRLKYLQSMNSISLNLLVTNDDAFKRYLKLQLFFYDYQYNQYYIIMFYRFNLNDHSKGKIGDIMVYLTNELHEDKNKLCSLLKRHPHWRYIPLLTIRKTCEFLKKKNFTNYQLCHCLQILLYPL